MRLNPHLDVDIVAVESEDEIALMLELVAPAEPQTNTHPPATLQIVLDRSGSMGGERLDAAKVALDALVTRLDPTAPFGLVVFDSDVEVAVPAGQLSDKDAVRAAIAGIHAGSMTNLSGGLLRGVQEARRAAGSGRATRCCSPTATPTREWSTTPRSPRSRPVRSARAPRPARSAWAWTMTRH